MSSRTPTDGIQLVQRIFALLRTVAAERGAGLRLSEIAARTELHLATTQRLLRALAQERAVVYDPYSRRYHIGYDFLQQPHDTLELRLKQHFRPALLRVAELTQDSAFLLVRHGLDALYIDSVHGRYPGKQLLPLDVGGRRPLGAGPGGLVLLSGLPLREQSRAIDANEERYARYNGVRVRDVRAMLRAYRRDGYAHARDNIVPGLSGLAVAIHDRRGALVAAMSIVTSNERLEQPRQARVAELMRRELARVGEFSGDGNGGQADPAH